MPFCSIFAFCHLGPWGLLLRGVMVYVFWVSDFEVSGGQVVARWG